MPFMYEHSLHIGTIKSNNNFIAMLSVRSLNLQHMQWINAKQKAFGYAQGRRPTKRKK
jgi:hypothetical protein